MKITLPAIIPAGVTASIASCSDTSGVSDEPGGQTSFGTGGMGTAGAGLGGAGGRAGCGS